MSRISQLTLAQTLGLTDQIVVDQGTPPITKRASLSQLPGLLALQFALNFQTGLNYNSVITDSPNTLILMNNAAANTVTIPPNASVPYPLGALLLLSQYGAGASSFLGGAGVTLLLSSTAQCRARYSIICAVQVTTDNWIVAGDSL
jgi:hypothetical protein